MCFPRSAADALCPQTQRPLDPLGNPVTAITTNDPAVVPAPPFPDVQAPLEVGDYIFFAGIVVSDLTGTAGPWPVTGVAGTYVSAYSITNNVGIWTAPGVNPAYIMVEVALMGTGGLSVLGAGEAVIRTRFEGMTTDQTRQVHLYGVDFAPGHRHRQRPRLRHHLPRPGRARWRRQGPLALPSALRSVRHHSREAGQDLRHECGEHLPAASA